MTNGFVDASGKLRTDVLYHAESALSGATSQQTEASGSANTSSMIWIGTDDKESLDVLLDSTAQADVQTNTSVQNNTSRGNNPDGTSIDGVTETRLNLEGLIE